MTARILLFPQRAPFVVRVVRDGAIWLVVCREHGWLRTDYRDAIEEAENLAHGFGVVVTAQQDDRRRA
jgi:hypothetical protein